MCLGEQGVAGSAPGTLDEERLSGKLDPFLRLLKETASPVGEGHRFLIPSKLIKPSALSAIVSSSKFKIALR